MAALPRQVIYHVHPLGWENDPEEERFPISVLDFVVPHNYHIFGLYFRLDNATKVRAVEGLRQALARTLSQTRHLCSNIEKDPRGVSGYSFVRRKGSTVELHVQWLDSPSDRDKYPSLDDMEQSHFSTKTLGNFNLWIVRNLAYGPRPEPHRDARPIMLALKANFVRGGLLLNTHVHHASNDAGGWAGFMHQLAENCSAFLNGVPYPPWDTACLDISRLITPNVPEDRAVDRAPFVADDILSQPLPVPGGSQILIFHLPKSKAAALKSYATPSPKTPYPYQSQPVGNARQADFISTYDALTAVLYRTLTRLRLQHYPPALRAAVAARHPTWLNIVDMRRRLGFPLRTQRNVVLAVQTRGPQAPAGILHPTAHDVAFAWPVAQLARYVRTMTDVTGTQEGVDSMVDEFSRAKDKTSMFTDVHNLPALTVFLTDHRGVGMVEVDDANPGANFGFGKVVGYRHIWGRANDGVTVVYEPRAGGVDEGIEITVAVETVVGRELVEDPEWAEWFEYRGVDWDEEAESWKRADT